MTIDYKLVERNAMPSRGIKEGKKLCWDDLM